MTVVPFFLYYADVRGSATSLDAMRSSHAIEVDVHHPAEINEIFDTISYAKGGTVIRVRTCGATLEPVASHLPDLGRVNGRCSRSI